MVTLQVLVLISVAISSASAGQATSLATSKTGKATARAVATSGPNGGPAVASAISRSGGPSPAGIRGIAGKPGLLGGQENFPGQENGGEDHSGINSQQNNPRFNPQNNQHQRGGGNRWHGGGGSGGLFTRSSDGTPNANGRPGGLVGSMVPQGYNPGFATAQSFGWPNFQQGGMMSNNQNGMFGAFPPFNGRRRR